MDIATTFDLKRRQRRRHDHRENLVQHLGPGIVANPHATAQCTQADFDAASPAPVGCDPSTQVGTATATVHASTAHHAERSRRDLQPRAERGPAGRARDRVRPDAARQSRAVPRRTSRPYGRPDRPRPQHDADEPQPGAPDGRHETHAVGLRRGTTRAEPSPVLHQPDGLHVFDGLSVRDRVRRRAEHEQRLVHAGRLRHGAVQHVADGWREPLETDSRRRSRSTSSRRSSSCRASTRTSSRTRSCCRPARCSTRRWRRASTPAPTRSSRATTPAPRPSVPPLVPTSAE